MKLRKSTWQNLLFPPAMAGLLLTSGFDNGLLNSGALVNSANAAGIIKLKDDGASRTQNVDLGLNKSIVVDLPRDASDLLVASPNVADAVIRSKRRIYVFGKSVGETNIFVFDRSGAPLLSLNLTVERDIAGLTQKLKRFIPGSDIDVEIINDNLVLTGSVETPQDSSRAVSLAKAFVTGGEATTGSFTQTATGGGTSGDVAISQPEVRDSQIVNLLKIKGEDQVMLKVTIAEVQRSVYKQLGLTTQFNGGSAGGVSYGSFISQGLGLGNPQGLNWLSASTPLGAAGRITSILDVFEKAGVARTLAEPSLTAISGKTADFSVGGSYYIGDGGSSADDAVTYGFKEIEYGIGLKFKPIVLGPGRISLEIDTNVSEPGIEGIANSGTGSRFTAALGTTRTRSAKTTVELPSGGSMVIAGLVRDNVRQAINKLPGLGNLPVLGALFRSRSFQRDETELVVIVTPYLVRPVARHKLQRPDKNFQPENDLRASILGRINKVYGRKRGKGHYNGKIGFIIQ